MSDTREVAATFDARARNYARNDWHRLCAERLVELCQLRSGNRVLDAGTGTGFAALAAAKVVGLKGSVCGVDISPGMLREARKSMRQAKLTNVEFVEGDAVHLPLHGSETFDVITCAAGLLYMSVGDALREWHRLIKRDGLVAFTTMRTGSPLAGRIFRDCAMNFGVSLRDPSEPLGSVSACRHVLEAVGFQVVNIVSETVEFSTQDLALAWESNFRSAGHLDVKRLGNQEQDALKVMYLDALAREVFKNPGALRRAEVLYSLGRC